ncbi:hypothetical protein [Brassicibacter mesophilus]|uniref:hypothetical protein n=1 Tax=Brassicibacter mesophilus TaxID=745119 RepID=UPI003D23C730
MIAVLVFNQWKINFMDIHRIVFYKPDDYEITSYRTATHDDIIQLLVDSFNETKKVEEISNIEDPSFYITVEYKSGRKKTFYLWISEDKEYVFYTKKKNNNQMYKMNEESTNWIKIYLGLKNH